MRKDDLSKAVSKVLEIVKRGKSHSDYPKIADLLLRLMARQHRRQIRRSAYGGSPGSQAARAADRFARDNSRKLIKQMRRMSADVPNAKLSKQQLLMRYVASPILDRLVADRAARWQPPLKRRAGKGGKSVRLKDFSFLTHPGEAILSLKALGELELSEREAYCHFEDEFCLDAGSYLVLAEVWHAVKHVLLGGKMQRSVQKVLAATGVGEHAQMRLLSIGHDADDDTADVWAFTLQRRRPARSSSSPTLHLDPQTRERTADQLCDKIDEWLGVPTIDQELTTAGRGWIAQIIGELLCNAERHSQAGSADGDWSTTAFMVRRIENSEATLRCYMAFLSVGRSIAEGLQDAAADIRSILQEYQARHRRCGISAATLATVFALQDTVTRDPDARDLGSGGTGLQDVLDFVDELGGIAVDGKEPHVTVISGTSCIQLRRPYIRGVRRDGPHAPRVIWFNPENSRDHPPDGAFVRDLEDHFAGTLVSLAFTLDPAYLAERTESDDENDRP